MNLLLSPWLDVIRQSGRRDTIAPTALTAGDDPVVDVWAPRLDFRAALYQFLIGLLQTAYAPADRGAWRERWLQPPDEAALSKAFAPYVDAFALSGEGPAFMQDFDLPQAEEKDVAALLIDAPGEKTIRDNLDHFVKRGEVGAMCETCAAIALFTLQINAPSGGVGHRVSLRGGGPLTTLLLPAATPSTLWHKLWLNVLPEAKLHYGSPRQRSDVLPWTAATRTSDPKGVGDTTPDQVHPLQAYWSMPRRIRLLLEDDSGECDLCGRHAERLVRRFRMRNYGVNYTGAWQHPLTPYSLDPKGLKPPLSVKGQRGGIGYRHWVGLTLGRDDGQPKSAANVQAYVPADMGEVVLWCSGYDMDNMKARCWYESNLPVHGVPADMLGSFREAVVALLDVAQETAELLHRYVKAARFKRPGDVAPEPAVPMSFWQATESEFYRCLANLARLDTEDEHAVAGVYEAWLSTTRRTALALFERWVVSTPIEGRDSRRVTTAWSALNRWLYQGKSVKRLDQFIKAYRKDKEPA